MNKKTLFSQGNNASEIIFGFLDVNEVVGNARMICVGSVCMLNSLWLCFSGSHVHFDMALWSESVLQHS